MYGTSNFQSLQDRPDRDLLDELAARKIKDLTTYLEGLYDDDCLTSKLLYPLYEIITMLRHTDINYREEGIRKLENFSWEKL